MIEVELKRVDFTGNEVVFSNLYVQKTDRYSFETIQDAINASDLKRQLLETLRSLEEAIISDAQNGGEAEDHSSKLFHNSSGNIDTHQSYTVFYRVLASESNPLAEVAFKAPQRIVCYPMEHVDGYTWRCRDLNHNEPVRLLDGREVDGAGKARDYKYFQLESKKYYIFVELAAVGRHIGNNSYEFDAFNPDLCDRDWIL